MKVPRGTTERLFGTLHRQFMERGYQNPPWEKLRPDDFTPEQVESARYAWASRAASEYRSLIVFGELIARFGELNLPLEVTSSASRLLTDEARHTELCARIADALGGQDGIELELADVRLERRDLPAHLFVARWTASMFCIGESASVGILQVLVQHTKNPCIEAVLRILLRDEILHDRFGWALARLLLPRLTDDEQEWLAADLARSFAHYDRAHGGSVNHEESDFPLPELLGLAPAKARHAAFQDRIHKVILPSLAQLGVPAYEAWELRTEVKDT
jgi:hypothetical protein